MDVAISSSLLGSKKNLLLSLDGVTWTDKIQNDTWRFSGEIKQSYDRCFDTALRLQNISDIPCIPDKYKKSMSILTGGTPPWSMVLPRHEYKSFFDDVISFVKRNRDISTSYYTDAFTHGNKVLNSIKPAKTDTGKINEICGSSAINSQVVESFRSRGGGYAQSVSYDRFGTVTGRLIVESGPNILLLKKDYRQILKPSHPDGRIISLDFSSLEARILLYESGKNCEEFDLYEMLARQFGGLPRAMVKAVVLSVLYGSSKAMVALHLGTTEEKISVLTQQIEDYINTKSLLKKLKQQHKQEGFITNRFGRKINLDRIQDNIFINYYAQSTGVDVSLIGFGKVLEQLGTNGVRPIFVLHDALILDVHPDRLQDVADISKVNVPGYDQAFPIKIEEISR